jgi:hypothetical protein
MYLYINIYSPFLTGACLSIQKQCDDNAVMQIVQDKRSRILEVIVVRRIFNLGTRNLEWGGNGKGLRKGRSVYE